jgi:hypothetical protein
MHEHMIYWLCSRTLLLSGSTDTFVFSVQPQGLENIPSSELPPLFNNATAVNVIDTGLTYNATYGGGNGITETLYALEKYTTLDAYTEFDYYDSGAIQLAPVSINGTDLQANNLTFANLYSSSSPTGASGLLGLGFPFNGAIYVTILEAFQAANQPLTAEETQRFFPIVPLLEYQGKIDQALFSIVVDRLDSEAPLTASNQFDTVFSNGTLTFGGYPDGYSCVPPAAGFYRELMSICLGKMISLSHRCPSSNSTSAVNRSVCLRPLAIDGHCLWKLSTSTVHSYPTQRSRQTTTMTGKLTML